MLVRVQHRHSDTLCYRVLYGYASFIIAMHRVVEIIEASFCHQAVSAWPTISCDRPGSSSISGSFYLTTAFAQQHVCLYQYTSYFLTPSNSGSFSCLWYSALSQTSTWH